jgi:type IV pilus assembly protein PilA
MLIQKLRGRIGSRLSGNSESGFTLIELLVVMLILGILAAIAIPAFFNQKSKAGDSKAKAVAHTAQVAMETCATDNNGSYASCTDAALRLIEPTLPPVPAGTAMGFTVPASSPTTYTITVTAAGTGNTFSVVRGAGGTTTFPCVVLPANLPNRGGCPAGGWG